MINDGYVKRIIEKTKKSIDKSIRVKNYKDALLMISSCANVLYQTNIYYQDDDLENSIIEISKRLNLSEKTEQYKGMCNDYIIFYDGFGLNNRGLIQIYLKALCKVKKVVYVTYEDRRTLIPDVQEILTDNYCDRRYINRRNKSIIEQIKQLNEYVREYQPSKMFFYSVPDDVIATTVMSAYEGVITRYQINLTDHAFWLGARMIDICIEFRNYGACISKEYRGLSDNKIRIIPFYPVINKKQEFLGFPFEKRDNQKIVFSGGALYKTLGCNNKYYKIVDHLLDKYLDVVFWYAGQGDDTEIKKLINKYPKRVYLTAERSDLYQILENCDIYLSTYPMCGGLMFQYAAMAGCVPVTLKKDSRSDGILINQENINVEFYDVKELYDEIDHLLTNDKYAQQRSELMRKSVFTPQVFEEEIRKLVNGERSETYLPSFEHIDTSDLRQWYLEGITKADISAMFIRKNAIKTGVIHYPLRIFRGGVRILRRRFL